jgi:hypothetical protein
MKKETPKSSAAPTKSDEHKARQSQEPASTPAPEGLDFSKLDLSIDRVDERLSPGESNIFDK